MTQHINPIALFSSPLFSIWIHFCYVVGVFKVLSPLLTQRKTDCVYAIIHVFLKFWQHSKVDGQVHVLYIHIKYKS